jgi:glycerol-3-phosphate dehydrogenase
LLFDFIIIGGGIVGASLAYELGKYRVSALLLEKEAELSFGVSKANSGIVHTGFQSDYRQIKTKLAVRGNEIYRDLAKLLEFPYDPLGELVVALPGETEGLYAIKTNGEKLGIPSLAIVERNWLRENEPNLSEDIESALMGPTAAVINPYETVYALAENAIANGVKILCEEEVVLIAKEKNAWKVTTSKTFYEARYVINAAGLYSDRVARMAGTAVPEILPRKGEEYLLDKHAKRLSRRVIFPLPTKTTKGVLIIPTADGNTMIGPTAEEIHDRSDVSTSACGKQGIVASARRLVPSIREDQIIASFAGLRPTTKEGDFHIREDLEGFVNLVGIQSPGLTAGPAIAEHVVKMLSDRAAFEPKRDHVPKRRAMPRLRALGHAERNQLIEEDPQYGEVVCRCELVSKKEIREAIRRGARTLDGVKFRTRSQMGRCHGSFCTMRIMKILSQELQIPYEAVTKRGKGSELIKTYEP